MCRNPLVAYVVYQGIALWIKHRVVSDVAELPFEGV